ncbi:MAG: SpoIIE family protein phosphatase [Phycisphaerales bacterium]|nr:SpoIIE family protein phosphatase [Phycisphaerales bacterium]
MTPQDFIDADSLYLDPVAGPRTETVSLDPASNVILGRSSTCDIQLTEDGSVSRRHLAIWMRSGRWLVQDKGSRHGTYLNGQRLETEQVTYLSHGDMLSVGPFVFRVRIGEDQSMFATTTEDMRRSTGHIEAIGPGELDNLASHRLGLLMNCAASIHAATDEKELARSVLNAVIRGTGFTRAALVRPVGSLEQVEVIASKTPRGDDETRDDGAFAFSRSVLKAASEHRIVRLRDVPDFAEAKSIIDLGIASALCAPIRVGPDLFAFLYLDSRSRDSHIESDAAAFCAAVAQMCGMAMANIQRHELEERQQLLEGDLRAARAAQMRMMPPEEGCRGGVSYAMRSLPGRGVAGDLFDVMALEGDRVAVMLGDVSGKGMGAAIIMAMTQSALATVLHEHEDLVRAVKIADRYVDDHSAVGEFVSLWLVLIDRGRREVQFVDAGHGYGVLRRASGELEVIQSNGGLPLGVEPSRLHRSDVLRYEAGDRLVLFSDGVTEQARADGERFGLDRVLSVLRYSEGERGDVAGVVKALFEFSEAEHLDDDVTVASIRLEG